MKPPPLETYDAVRNWLYGLRNRGSKYGLRRMRVFVEKLGHPERKLPSIHVAGTNGKGSVCAMLERVFRETGLKTGLFTSPHLVHQGERIQVCREILAESQILTYTNELLPVAEEMARQDPEDHPSFFEWMTAMAFLHFNNEKVDLVIWETGLGGRLDSTNVVDPEVSVITSVGLDHTEILGDTIEAIAREKAGIVKPGRPVVLGKMPEEARRAIKAVATERGSPVHMVEERFAKTVLPETNLAGTIQRWNAATALLTCEILRHRFPAQDSLVRSALQDVRWFGRWSREEFNGRILIFDAAHNADAANALQENLATLSQKPTIIAGYTGSPDRAKAILPTLAAHAENLILVQPSHPRGLAPEAYAKGFPWQKVEQLFPLKGICTVKPADVTVVVTGSIYLIAEIYERLSYEQPQGQQILQD